ncbi:MAG: saccharopine dehydrogenase NADP-binding domain-containing protein [Alkalispirochaeta sp.]
MAVDSRIDITLLGATGFVGRLTARHLYRRCRQEGLTFAIAGRNRERLEALAQELVQAASPERSEERIQESDDRADPPVIRVASTDDATALARLARESSVLCSTVGPYARLGTEVVATCVQEQADYCDLTGEVQWMRRMIDRFDETAQEQGVRIIHAAGFDSIPSDLGVLLAQTRLREIHGHPAGQLRLRVHRQAGGVSRGTLDSMVQLVREAARDPGIREFLKDPHSLEPGWTPPGRRAPRPRWRDAASGEWTVPFFMEEVNRRVVYRSNALTGYPWGREFDYREIFLLPRGGRGFLTALVVRVLSRIGPALIAFPPTRALISTTLFPKPGEGPKVAREEGGNFEVRIEDPETGQSVVSVAADRDPGYGATAIMLGETAILLCQTRAAERGQEGRRATGMGGRPQGGVLTPAAALGHELAERLTRAGVRFTVEL